MPPSEKFVTVQVVILSGAKSLVAAITKFFAPLRMTQRAERLRKFFAPLKTCQVSANLTGLECGNSVWREPARVVG